jgi:predicted Zn-dependent peptidase
MFLLRADRLAKLQALWGDARVVNQVPGWIEGVTSADVQRVATTYLTKANRSVIDRKPAAMLAPPAAAASAASAPLPTKPASQP